MYTERFPRMTARLLWAPLLEYARQENHSIRAREELVWESCPVCGSPAAVGRESRSVSVECTAGCPVTPALVAALEAARA